MATADIQHVPATVVRKCIDLLNIGGEGRISAAEFIQFFEKNGYSVGRSCRAMVQRELGTVGERPNYEALTAAADEFVAACDGKIEDAFDALAGYRSLSGTYLEAEANASRTPSTDDLRI